MGIRLYSLALTALVLAGCGAGSTAEGGRAATESEASWGPIGAGSSEGVITFVDGAFNVYAIRPDGSNLRPLLDEQLAGLSVAFSPDGSLVAYETGSPPHIEVKSLVVEREVIELPGESTLSGSCIGWSPDGAHIVYERKNEQAGVDLWVASADGSTTEVLVRGGTAIAHRPLWSPDGTKLAFLYVEGRDTKLWVMEIAGGESRSLTEGLHLRDMAWWPDGSGLVLEAFDTESDSQGLRDLWSVGLGTGQPSKLSRKSGWLFAVPSPDGNKLLATGEVESEGVNSPIFVLTAEGAIIGQLPQSEGAGGRDWSPDGDRIVFASGQGLFVVNVDGSGLRQLTNKAARRADWLPPAP